METTQHREKEDGYNPYWSEEVDAHLKWHAPEGTFTEKAPEVVKVLMKGAHNDPTLALRRLVFYMNRAGDRLSNADELDKAKAKLEELERKDKKIKS